MTDIKIPHQSADDSFSEVAEAKKLPGSLADKVAAGRAILDSLLAAAKKVGIDAKLDSASDDLALIVTVGTMHVIVLVNARTGEVHVYNPAIGSLGHPLPLRYSRAAKEYTSPDRIIAADGTARWGSAVDVVAYHVRSLLLK